MNAVFENAKKVYGELGVDVEAAMKRLESVPVSLHCWQGDDVTASTMTDRSPAVFRPRATTPARRALPMSCSPIWKRLCPSAPARRS